MYLQTPRAATELTRIASARDVTLLRVRWDKLVISIPTEACIAVFNTCITKRSTHSLFGSLLILNPYSGIQGPPGPGTDWSEWVQDFQIFLRTDPVRNFQNFLAQAPDRITWFWTNQFWSVDFCPYWQILENSSMIILWAATHFFKSGHEPDFNDNLNYAVDSARKLTEHPVIVGPIWLTIYHWQ